MEVYLLKMSAQFSIIIDHLWVSSSLLALGGLKNRRPVLLVVLRCVLTGAQHTKHQTDNEI